MTIKTKLMLNVGVVLVAMTAIVALAIFGTRYTKSNIRELTQKTTPYQVKALNLQRSLQAHAANLLSLSTSVNLDEFARQQKMANDSLSQVTKSYNELGLLKGTSASDEVRNITEITNDFFEKDRLKLSANVKSFAAAQAIKLRLEEASRRIRDLDASIRKLQKNTSSTMISGVDGLMTVNQQASNLMAARDGLKDLSLYIAKIPVTNDKRSVATLRDNAGATIKKVVAALKNTRGMDKAVNDMILRLNALSEKVTATRGLAFLQLKYISEEDDSLRDRIETMSREGVYEISYIMPTIERAIITGNGLLKSSTTDMSRNINAFSDTNNILSCASVLFLVSSSIESHIIQSVSQKNSKDFTAILSRLENAFARADATVKQLNVLLAKGRHKNELAMLSSFSSAFAVIKQDFLSRDGVADKVRAAIKNTEQLDALNNRMKEIVAKQLGESNQEVSAAGVNQEKAIVSVNRISNLTMLIIGVVGIISIFCVMIIGIWISRSITSPLRDAVGMSIHISKSGDLTKRLHIKTDDEIGAVAKSFNVMVERIHSTISTVLGKVNTVASSSANLSETAEHISKKAGFQAQHSDALNNSADEMSAGVRAVSENANISAEFAEDTKRIAAEGGEVIMETIDGIKRVAVSIREVSTTIDKLAGRSEKIGEIAQVIKDIADQTNLLSLNAAIEAARAGEQGKGFAVVADSVRHLAERTTNATVEIAEMIHSIQVETEQSSTAMNKGIEEVTRVVEIANRAGDALNQIVCKIEKTSEMIQQMVSASDQQFTTVDNMTGNIKNISEASREFATATTQIAQAAEDLDKVSLELKGLVNQFVI